jgi:hypothetical protein
MTMTNKSTPSQGYSICDCGEGVLLHEAGYEVDLHMCAVCRCMVADTADFANPELVKTA